TMPAAATRTTRCNPATIIAASSLLLEAFDEPLEQPRLDLVLADLVLDTMLEVGSQAEIYCRFRRLRGLNPFVACRDQPDERPQEPRGITRWDQKNKDGISGRRIRLRNEEL